jgi:hypothetical protein
MADAAGGLNWSDDYSGPTSGWEIEIFGMILGGFKESGAGIRAEWYEKSDT